MPNTILTATAVTREALRVLHQKLNFVAGCATDPDTAGSKTPVRDASSAGAADPG